MKVNKVQSIAAIFNIINNIIIVQVLVLHAHETVSLGFEVKSDSENQLWGVESAKL